MARDTSEDYRKLEQAALEEASRTEDPAARLNLLSFARMWSEMAQAEAQREAASPKEPQAPGKPA